MSLAGNLSLDLQKNVGLHRPAPGPSIAQHPLQFQSKPLFCFDLVIVKERVAAL